MSNITLYKATARFQRISPFKIRPVADHIRNRSYSDAIAILNNLHHKGARLLRMVLLSAVANAKVADKNLDDHMLCLHTLTIDEGPRMKRYWLRGRGRSDRIYKRFSHISISVCECVALNRKRRLDGSKG